MKSHRIWKLATVLSLLIAAVLGLFFDQHRDALAVEVALPSGRIRERSSGVSSRLEATEGKIQERRDSLIPLREGLRMWMNVDELKTIYPHLLGAEGPPILVSMEKNDQRARLNFCFYPTREVPAPLPDDRLKLVAIYQENLDRPETGDQLGIYLFPPELRGQRFTGLMDGWERGVESGY